MLDSGEATSRSGTLVSEDEKAILALTAPVLAHRLMLREDERLRGGSPVHILEEIVARCPIPDPLPR